MRSREHQRKQKVGQKTDTALQTTLSTEVAHFTQDEQNILHCGTPATVKTAAEPSIPVGNLRLKEGHIKI